MRLLLSLPPVLVFLAVLVVIDSFKLVSFRGVLRSLLAGGLAALMAWYLNRALLGAGVAPEPAFSRYVSPLVEEILKALYVVFLLKGQRVGFLVDAAIHGFAVGAGFAQVENLYYLRSLPDGGALLWLVRGFGTALLHGSTTSVFAMISKTLADRRPSVRLVFLPGGVAALLIHSLFNHFILHPLLATALLLVVVPLIMIAVFERSRLATRAWLGGSLDDDVEFLRAILSGQAGQTRVGEYLRSLRWRFRKTVVADMLCLIRIDLELSVRGKGLLIARDAGLHLSIGEDVRADLKELEYLERAVGPTGLWAIRPLLKSSHRDLWHLYLLDEGAADGGRGKPAG